MSPLRYQKWLRLNEVRRPMLNEHYDVTTAAYAVDYKNEGTAENIQIELRDDQDAALKNGDSKTVIVDEITRNAQKRRNTPWRILLKRTKALILSFGCHH